jgi:hypothetical protein
MVSLRKAHRISDLIGSMLKIFLRSYNTPLGFVPTVTARPLASSHGFQIQVYPDISYFFLGGESKLFKHFFHLLSGVR